MKDHYPNTGKALKAALARAPLAGGPVGKVPSGRQP
jgi:hypothetical protein